MKFHYEVAQRKLIYVFAIPGLNSHRGLLKIGEATFNGKDLKTSAHERIKTYTTTAGIAYNLLHTEFAVKDNGDAFSDRDVHKLLKRFKTTINGTAAREWFKISLHDAIAAINAVKQGKKFFRSDKAREEIIFRDEQRDAINRTVEYFSRGNEFLWNAKMRFGKTLCALEVARRMNFARTIIVTHRPDVKAGWFEDFDKIFGGNENFDCGSRDNGSTLDELLAGKKNFVYFASIQDLRGSDTVGGKFDKNSVAFKTAWDFVIVDEAHEGTQTDLGDKVIKTLVKPSTKFLELSGTPFNLLDDYDAENIYTWSYVDEQRAKAEFAAKNPLEHNPYAELPQMNILTYNLGDILQKLYVDDAEEISFSFREFFRVDGGHFVHEDDVKNFLDLLVKRDDNNYPFATPDWREQFRHTFWLIPGVKEALALSELLQNHKVFSAFKIVNVAGDGDPDDKRDEALKKVRSAINEYDYTITLSCGKLTTGVTVPEWSAVFMLKGSNSDDNKTSATSYLQTIFRVQSPCNKGGVIKTNCYVFDFAPDRTLKVITESLKISARAGKTTVADRKIFDSFVKFCPVIAVEGSRMNPINADNLMQKLKRAQAERVVRNGFADNYLYNDELLRLTDLDITKFAELRGIIGTSKAQKKTSDITINAQGLDKVERKKLRDELKRDPTPEEIEERRQRNVRNSAISILRGISIRMPLLIYGAEVPFDDDITIDDFADLIDDDSWTEFMPKGVTKDLFAQFVQYYDRDVFIAAGRRVRKFAKNADALIPTERVKKIAELFATFKNPDKETVLTPWRVVKLHIDAAFDEKFFTPDKKILEINSKTGLYPLYVACKIYRARLADRDEKNLPRDELQKIWDAAVAENVFVICKTPMAEKITRRTLRGYHDKATVNARDFKDLIATLKNTPSIFTERIIKESFWSKGVGKMFFDAVVGNPPYQNATANTSDEAVYHLFIESAQKLSDRVSLIHPARCLFNAGKTPKDFNQRLLANKHFKVIRYEQDSAKFFPSSDIKGGVAITLYDAAQNFGAIGTFIPFDELISIHQKAVLDNPNFRPLSEIVFAPESYHFTQKFHADNPNVIKILSDGHADDLTTNIFEKLPMIFLDNKPDDGNEYIQIYGLIKMRRTFKLIRRDYVRNETNLDKYKIIVPKSNGSGALGEVVSTPLVGSTQTFISVGAFDTRAEADACIAYIKSKFCRVMLGILKVTQHNPPQTWSKVPLQDFTSSSDIDWNVSIHELDLQLYRKYGLSASEIEFIESHVKEMT